MALNNSAQSFHLPVLVVVAINPDIKTINPDIKGLGALQPAHLLFARKAGGHQHEYNG